MNSIVRLLITLPVAVVLLFLSAALAQTEATAADQGPEKDGKKPLVKVVGKLVDRDGKPVKSEVQYKSPLSSGSVATSADGKFSFEAPAGTYEFSVKVGGKAASVGSKDISSGQVELIMP